MMDERLRRFTDDDSVRKGVELTLALLYFLMVDIYEGMPSEAEIRGTAEEIARAESWAPISADDTSAVLLRLLARQPLGDAVSAESLIIIVFVSAANLLSSCRRDDEEWWDYLDRAEAALEAV